VPCVLLTLMAPLNPAMATSEWSATVRTAVSVHLHSCAEEWRAPVDGRTAAAKQRHLPSNLDLSTPQRRAVQGNGRGGGQGGCARARRWVALRRRLAVGTMPHRARPLSGSWLRDAPRSFPGSHTRRTLSALRQNTLVHRASHAAHHTLAFEHPPFAVATALASNRSSVALCHSRPRNTLLLQHRTDVCYTIHSTWPNQNRQWAQSATHHT
jgi:hypothetical protein